MSGVKLCYSVCHLFFTRKLGRAVANSYVGMTKAFLDFGVFQEFKTQLKHALK